MEIFTKFHRISGYLPNLEDLVNITITFCALQTKRLLGNVEADFRQNNEK
ncbi:hypothetical protein J524_3336 [Acinetobacter baumannii 496487]|nr:hypothetical protein J552_3239 [Acinetobacter baumannii 951631]EXE65936.1 hypothetical protein J585_3731 [Acinetobacter baumannii 397971]EXG07084.1 hypothetical protein J712_3811 [Acinetobacter baumannii 722310]EXH52657.1 hypothetical protein J620_3744 [Acinetobacter baumannii 1533268]EXH97887.1 hypothetical protein J618_3750 [Acinetobacter baumannii 607805]EXH98415.1 hypothetical protein J639_3852 [Acinetobacter baumannii 457946]EXQ88430.1 hypothetical protein J681_3777 [Acinetobacter bau